MTQENCYLSFTNPFRCYLARHEFPSGCCQWQRRISLVGRDTEAGCKSSRYLYHSLCRYREGCTSYKTRCHRFYSQALANEKLIATVSSALQLSFSRTEVETLKQQKETLKKQTEALTLPPEPARVIGESAAMQTIFKRSESSPKQMRTFCSWEKTEREKT